MPTTSIYKGLRQRSPAVTILYEDPSIKDGEVEEKGRMQLVELSIQRVVFLIVSQDDSRRAVKRPGRPHQHNDPIQVLIVTRSIMRSGLYIYIYIRLNLKPIN